MKKIQSLFTSLVGVTALWGALVIPQFAEAAVITVTTTDQEAGPNANPWNGNCTLGEAIEAAVGDYKVDKCPAGEANDTIVLAQNATYTLDVVATTIAGVPAGLPSLNGATVTIEGNNATVMRNPNAAAFNILDIRSGSIVSVKNLTIKNGKLTETGQRGAGISVYGADVTLDHVTLQSNSCASDGGGLHVDNSPAQYFANVSNSVSVLGSTFQDNSGALGSGSYFTDIQTLVIKNSTFSKNTGLAVYILGHGTSTAAITDTVFSQNTAGTNAVGVAGMLISSPAGKVNSCSFTGNQGIALENTATLWVENSYFKDNVTTVTGGQGQYYAGAGSAINNGTGQGILTVVNSSFSGNSSSGEGGAVFNNGKSVALINDTISGNSSKIGGGAVFAGWGAGPITLTNTILYNNTPNNCTSENNTGHITSSGYNITQDNDGCPKVAGDIAVKATDIVLSQFTEANYPGYGVFFLPPGSFAINAGTKNASTPEKDQLGVLRDAKYDIGAIEARCADGYVHTILGEECDDKNYLNGDGCNSTCKVEAGYSCTGNPSLCQKTCGNGSLEVGEQCDDGNVNNSDGCSSSCIVEDGFGCFGSPSVCVNSCGNGNLDGGTEKCDDGNKTSGDGCSAKCQIEPGYSCAGTPSVCKGTCGNGVLEKGEQCDDNNIKDGDGCSSGCLVEDKYSCSGSPSLCAPTCGDGKVVSGLEACDDGNKNNGDGCSDTCTVEKNYFCGNKEPSDCGPWCGDGVTVGTEECDDGNYTDGDGCNHLCKKEGCGDGIAQTAIKEQCDGVDLDKKDCLSVGLGFDGGTLSCNADCTFNTTACTATPKESCGDGKKNGIELCDKEDLGGKTCTSLGLDFVSGKITCNPDCTINTSECKKPKIPEVEKKPEEQTVGTNNGSTTPTTNTQGSTSGAGGTATTSSTSSGSAEAAPASSGGGGGGCSLIR